MRFSARLLQVDGGEDVGEQGVVHGVEGEAVAGGLAGDGDFVRRRGRVDLAFVGARADAGDEKGNRT